MHLLKWSWCRDVPLDSVLKYNLNAESAAELSKLRNKLGDPVLKYHFYAEVSAEFFRLRNKLGDPLLKYHLYAVSAAELSDLRNKLDAQDCFWNFICTEKHGDFWKAGKTGDPTQFVDMPRHMEVL